MMNKECKLITPENIQGELINNEIEQINLRAQAFKEQKYNELLKENKDLQTRISKAIEYMNSEEFFMKMNSNSIQPPADKYVCQDYFEAKEKLVETLGGDVDDE